ncbi:urease accessory protein UreF [Romeria aff. gracilis LEGE 07310]|uniref:Urease accessory protein UreF n=1 Tax=Vasconcelosia minhoensis LEGE 07310 TaxID=915328 RepID=A0A8J7A6W3_9CYAN|nr:urease accessory UreF family protein [Romeria gracilis]MBE9077140.1 urease accessory protein UreF [Romeria aff. gracilis LEGE 07310]
MTGNRSVLDSRLALMQLSDSFFPSGSFTLSHGLESLAHSGQIQSPQDFQDFLHILLYQKVGSSDLVALLHAYQASQSAALDEIRQADLSLFAQTLIQPVREAQGKSGRALLMVARSTWPDRQLDWLADQISVGQCHGLHPVVFAVVGRAAGLEPSDILLAYLHSFVTGLCGAAIRLGVLGHLKAQLVLKAIAPELETVIAQATDLTLEDMWTCTPLIDIAQMGHQHLPQRQFMT